jgi:UDPglucose 6-dehydrogenase
VGAQRAPDDVRESPALRVAKLLLAEGAKVVGYDPVARNEALLACPDLTFAAAALEAAQGADAVVLATDWKEFPAADWKAVKAAMRSPVIFDGRNCLDAPALRSLGFTVLSVGRG